MKKASILDIIVIGITILLVPFIIFYGCAKKGAVKKEAPVEMSEETKGEVSGEGAEGEGMGLPAEGEVEEETLMDEGAVLKIQEQMMDINFEFDQFTLTDTARDKLSKNASVLLKKPSLYVLIEGHCDERGTEEYNLALGERRANSAKQYLVTSGINESRISTISYGEEKPMDPEHNEVAWAKNRRDHFVISVK